MGQPERDGEPRRGRLIGIAPAEWLAALRDLGERGVGGVLVTVIARQGSAPREPGARLIVTPDAVHGSIGGGRVELDAIAAARDILAAGAGPSVRRISLGASLGQCCGGVMTLLFEPTAAAGWPGVVRNVLDQGRPCVVATVVESPAAGGVPVSARLIVAGGDVVASWGAPALEAGLRDRIGSNDARAGTAVVLGHTLFLERLAPDPAVVLFGAGHVGRALASILGALPCAVTWVDERAEQFPAAAPPNVRVEPADAPEYEVDAAPPGASFVVMTHSHQRDFGIVERVLRRGDFAYLGMIGSTSKRRRFEQRLRARGIATDAIARLRCPIGLAGIPGKHPGAIAVAAAAELLRVWDGA